MNKKGFTSIVATSLLIIIVIGSIIGFQQWNQQYSTQLRSNVEQQTNIDSNIKINALIQESLYVINSQEDGVVTVKINGDYCQSNVSLSKGTNEIDVGTCIEQDESILEVLVYGSNGIETSRFNNQFSEVTLEQNEEEQNTQFFFNASDENVLGNFTKLHGDGTLEVVDDNGNKAFFMESSDNPTYFSIKEMEDDVEIAVKIRSDSTAVTGNHGGVFSRFSSINVSGYRSEIRSNERIRIRRIDDGDGVAISSEERPDQVGPLDEYNIYIFSSKNNTLSLRAWHAENNEDPGEWDIVISDSNYSQGHVGIQRGNSARDIYIQWIGVGIDGDLAPLGPLE